MAAYYNEVDPFAAAWLRKLIKAGHIADGDVDERDIRDINPIDLIGYDQCHFFAGIGVWSYALRLAGWEDDRPVWTGSCPCQPFSVAGKGGGTADERHLWPSFFHLIEQHKPGVVFGEQVASDDGLKWLDGVWADMESTGYSFAAADLCAAGVGAPHIRQRLYWVGDAKCEGLERHDRDGTAARGAETTGSDTQASSSGARPSRVDAVPVLRRVDVHDSRRARTRLRLPADRRVENRPLWSEFEALPCSDGWRRVQPGTFPLAHGASQRVGRLRAYGNAIVAQVAAKFITAYMETHRV